MRRDLDLIRLIMLEIEKAPIGERTIPEIEGYSASAIAYHTKLLKQAGLIEAFSTPADDHQDWIPTSITWDGHEFLDLARDDPKWKKAKQIIQTAGSFSFPIVLDILKNLFLP